MSPSRSCSDAFCSHFSVNRRTSCSLPVALIVRDQPHHPALFGGLQLRRVAGQDHPRPRLRAMTVIRSRSSVLTWLASSTTSTSPRSTGMFPRVCAAVLDLAEEVRDVVRCVQALIGQHPRRVR